MGRAWGWLLAVGLVCGWPALAQPAGTPAAPVETVSWLPFGAPEFEAAFPGPFKVKAGPARFEVSCEVQGQLWVAGWAKLEGPLQPQAVAQRLKKAGFQLVSPPRPGPVGGRSGLHLDLKMAGDKIARARVVQREDRLFEALWVGKQPPPANLDKFWGSFKVN